MAELARIGVGERVLVLGLVQSPADGDVLRRLHIERDALDLGEPLLQAQDYLVRARVTLALGLQRDEHTPRVGRIVTAAEADGGADRSDRRILEHGADQRLRPLRHGLIGNILPGFRKTEDQTGILLRKETLGNDHVEVAGQRDGGEHYHQRHEAMPQHDLEARLINIEHDIEAPFEHPIKPSVLLALGLEHVRAHHRCERPRDHQ